MNQIIANAPTSAAVVAGTVVSGTAGWLDLIPDDISKLSALVGIALSLVLGWYHIKIGNAKLKQMQAELDNSESGRDGAK
jgi:hypothetical protein|tara:strand:- start:838 stop:1077 length:240 start_codon:yes stop_codon:yes gene_type:complete